MFCLAGERSLPASEHVHQNINRRAGMQPQNQAPFAGVAAEQSIIVKRNLLGPPAGGKPLEMATIDPLAGLQATSLDLVLMGIVDGRNQDSRAIILTKKDRKQRIYQTGDMVAGAQIKSILWGRVVLSTNGRDEVLDMSEAAKFRSGEVGGPVSAAARAPSQEEIVATSEAGEITSKLIPERVRIVLPVQEAVEPQNDN